LHNQKQQHKPFFCNQQYSGLPRVLGGSSPNLCEDAATNTIIRASKSLRDLRIAEVTKLDIKIEDGKPAQFRTNKRISFKYQDYKKKL